MLTCDDDPLRILVALRSDDDALAGLQRLLGVFDRSFLPKPTELERPDSLRYEVDGFSDPYIVENLRREIEGSHLPIQLLHGSIETCMVISVDGRLYSLTEHRLLPPDYASAARDLILAIAEQVRPQFVQCCLDQVSRAIYRRHFQWCDRTRNSPSLVWLQYFAGAELERQGGDALLQNPHASVKRVADGLLIEVGSSPEDACTPDGEALLVQATRAMPPIR